MPNVSAITLCHDPWIPCGTAKASAISHRLLDVGRKKTMMSESLHINFSAKLGADLLVIIALTPDLMLSILGISLRAVAGTFGLAGK